MIGQLFGNLLGTNKINDSLDKISKQLAGESIEIPVTPTLKDRFKKLLVPKSFKDIKMEITPEINKKMATKNISKQLKEISNGAKAKGLGADKQFDTATAIQYSRAIQGINEEEAKALLQKQGLSKVQQDQVISQAAYIASQKSLNASLVSETLLNSTLEEQKAQEILQELGLVNAQTGEIITTKQVTAEKVKEALATKGIVGAEAEAIMAKFAAGNASLFEAGTFKLLTAEIYKNITAFVTWMATTPAGWFVAIAVAVAGITAAIVSHNKRQQEMRKEIQETAETAKQSVDDIRSSFEDLSTKTNDIKKRYAELAQGVNQFTGKNNTLSLEEYEEFLDLSNQLSELFPDLTKHYDENGNAILDLTGNVDTIVGSLNNLVETQRQLAQQEILNSLPSVYAGLNQNITDIQENMDALEERKKKLSTALLALNNPDYIYTQTGLYADDPTAHWAVQVATEFGIELESIQLDEGGYKLQVKNVEKLDDVRREILRISQDIIKTQNKLQSEMTSFNKYLFTWLSGELLYQQIGDENIQQAIQNTLYNADWFSQAQAEGIDMADSDAVLDWLRKTYLEPLNQLEQPYKDKLAFLFDGSLLPEEKVKLAQELQKYFAENGIQIDLSFVWDFTEDGSTADIVNRFTIKNNELLENDRSVTEEDLNQFFESQGIDTETEYEAWLTLASSYDTATEAMNAYYQAMKGSKKTNLEVLSGIQSLSKGLDMLSDIYVDVKDGGEFDWSSILNNDEFKEIFDDYDEEYKNFIETVANSPDDIDACQSAFNDLVTAYILGSDELNHVTEETRNATIAFLEQKGVANATQIVDEKLSGALLNMADAERVAADNGLRLETVTAESIEALVTEGVIVDKTAKYLASYAFQKQLSNKTAIKTTEDCQNLINLAKTAGYSQTYLMKLEALKEKLAKNPSGYKTSGFQLEMERIRAEAQAEADKVHFDLFSIDYNGGKVAENVKETFDWIETKISRLQRAIANFGKTVSATWKSWSTRNNALGDEIAGLKEEIDVQDDAYNYYMAEANKVNLSEEDKILVREGAIDIDEISDETRKENIQKYQEYYEKALSAKDAKIDAEDSLAGKLQEQFDLIISKYDGLISEVEHRVNMLNAAMEGAELRGQLVGRSYYEEMAKHEEKNIAFLKQKQKELEDEFNNPSKYGIDAKDWVGSEEWYNLQGQIWEVEEAIAEANNTLQEYNNSMLEADWNIFEKQQEYISQLHSETEFLLDLLDNDDLFDKDTAQMTDNGRAAFGLHVVDYHTYLEEAEDYAEQIAKIEEEIAEKGESTTLLEKKQEYIEAQREAILNAQAEKEAIRDLYEEYYNNLLDVLQEVIDKRKEELQATKD